MAHTSRKEEQRELKGPDSFQKVGQEAVPWMIRHQNNIVVGAVVVVIVGLGLGLTSFWNHRKDELAKHALGEAMTLLSRPVVESASAPSADDKQPSFKSEKEKDEAIIAKLTEFRRDHSGESAAVQAALPLAQALLRQGKSTEALDAFEEFIKHVDATDPLRYSALEGKGYALENKKDYGAAIAVFDELATSNSAEFMKGMGLYHRGRILAEQGKKTEAAKVFSDVVAQSPSTASSRLAADRIALLKLEGVVVPEKTSMGASDAGR